MPPETDAAATDSGALSIDQATSLLGTPPKKEAEAPEVEVEVAPEVETDSEVEPTETEENGSEVEEPGAAEVVEAEPAVTAVTAPTWWNAEAKAKFAALPPELQAVVMDQEGKREQVTQRAKQEAAEARKKAEAEANAITPLKQALDQLLPRANQIFSSRWANVDWAAWADTDPQAAFKGRAQFEAEQAELGRLHQAHQIAHAEDRKKFVETEEAKLKEIAPELSDPEKGPARRQAIGKFMLERGATPDELMNVDARLLSLADDALKYRELKAEMAKAVKQSAAPKLPANPTVRPTAAAPSRSPNARLDTLNRKRTLSIDEAVELQTLRG